MPLSSLTTKKRGYIENKSKTRATVSGSLCTVRQKVVVEPSAAIGVAALISGGFKVKPGEKVCFVLTGGNIDPKKLIDLTEC